MQEKVIPHSIEAEQAVLGSMFLSKYALQKSIEELNKDLFYLDSHSKIFAVISDLAETNRPIDIVSVTAELDKRKELKQKLYQVKYGQVLDKLNSERKNKAR